MQLLESRFSEGVRTKTNDWTHQSRNRSNRCRVQSALLRIGLRFIPGIIIPVSRQSFRYFSRNRLFDCGRSGEGSIAASIYKPFIGYCRFPGVDVVEQTTKLGVDPTYRYSGQLFLPPRNVPIRFLSTHTINTYSIDGFSCRLPIHDILIFVLFSYLVSTLNFLYLRD